jgi:hypothetical protein
MVRLEDIPEFAICSKCGRPYQVVDFSAKAASLGLKAPVDSFVFKCCGGGELTIEDEDAELELRDLLLAYHAQQNKSS